MKNTSLSQGIGKRTSGKLRVDASVQDISKRSHSRQVKSVGSSYSLINSGNLIKVEFAQTGERQDTTRFALVGELFPNGFKSYSVVSCEGLEFSWDDIADLIGVECDRLLASVLKFARTQKYVETKSARDFYSSRVENRHKSKQAKRSLKGVRIG